MTDKRIVLVTVPDKKLGENIAAELIRLRLAACVNIIPGITSIYEWEGKVETGSEILLIIKTRVEAFDALRRIVQALHPYQVPEIISVPVEMGLQKYLDWVDAMVPPAGAAEKKQT
ncbi:MAG TPA: divalent-cation tolerance protein CutA [Candidatus Ozemobacteraceae bacterium]|nr:divalent-cation tolerance protein CutA [Candidatus Ozemobacteraceae bacterium]